MCGIAGCIHPDIVSKDCGVSDQVESIGHRGPDSRGIYQDRGISIGQARLSIIDLETGDPPICSEDETFVSVLNGEIYNFKSLQVELKAAGHKLSTKCDTEVLAHLAEYNSPSRLANKLDGMFAFAVLDTRRREIMLGRDPVGKKPLYYYDSPSLFVFGSEIKAVLAHPGVPHELNDQVLLSYLTFGYVPSPDTFFKGIYAVPPGHTLVRGISGACSIEPFWTLSIQNQLQQGLGADAPDLRSNSGNFQASARNVRRLLEMAVEKRLVSDVPLGAFLSGGIDSSAIVAIMARLTNQPVNTFTIGFNDNEGFDERPYAETIAKRYKTNHTEFVVDPDASSHIEALVRHYDSPIGDSSALPTYLLSELTKSQVTVALCGDGGDELFGGYERFAAALAVDKFHQIPKPVLKVFSSALNRVLPASTGYGAKIGRLLEAADLAPHLAFLKWMSFVSSEWRGKLTLLPPTRGTEGYERLWNSYPPNQTLLQRLQRINIETYLLDDLLPKVDRMSMAHGLEVRSPFLDKALLGYAIALPDRHKVFGLNLKRVLKEAVQDLLPAELLARKKHGFGIPLHRWFREDLRGYVESNLCANDASVATYLDPDAIRSLLDAHMSGQELGHAIWTLLTLEIFLKQHGW